MSDASAIIQLPILSASVCLYSHWLAHSPVYKWGPYIICLRLPIKEHWIHSLNTFDTRDRHYCTPLLCVLSRTVPLGFTPHLDAGLRIGRWIWPVAQSINDPSAMFLFYTVFLLHWITVSGRFSLFITLRLCCSVQTTLLMTGFVGLRYVYFLRPSSRFAALRL